MAWLAAVPKPAEGSKRAQHQDDKRPKLSRLEKMKKSKVEPTMPPNPAPHIVQWLVEIGLVESNGMGATPLTWREINEWQKATSITLAPWEARLIRNLSREYMTESKRAESEHASAPFRMKVTKRERRAEEKSLEDVLG